MPLNFEPVPYEEAARIVAEKQIMPKGVVRLKASHFNPCGGG